MTSRHYGRWSTRRNSEGCRCGGGHRTFHTPRPQVIIPSGKPGNLACQRAGRALIASPLARIMTRLLDAGTERYPQPACRLTRANRRVKPHGPLNTKSSSARPMPIWWTKDGRSSRPFLTSGIFLWGWRHSKPATTLNGITLSGASMTATTTVLIVAERYGSELKGKSYTQMEYEYAVAQGVPTVAFFARRRCSQDVGRGKGRVREKGQTREIPKAV
jgi:hypothetical protein